MTIDRFAVSILRVFFLQYGVFLEIFLIESSMRPKAEKGKTLKLWGNEYFVSKKGFSLIHAVRVIRHKE